MGDLKTGTTSIQQTLASGTWQSPGKSIHYSAPINHIPLADSLRARNPRRDRLKIILYTALSYIFSRAEVGVISAENFQFHRPEVVKGMIDRYFFPLRNRVRVIAYIRPHADAIVARFSEHVKQGRMDGDMEQFLEKTRKSRIFFYHQRLKRWRRVFGDRFEVRPYVRSMLKDGDAVADFFDFVLKGADVRFTAPTRDNPSLCMEDLVMIREFHTMLKQEGDDLYQFVHRLGWNLALTMTSVRMPDSTPLRMDRAMLDRVEAIYADDARAIDAEFFSGDPFQNAWSDARKKAVDEPLSLETSAYFSSAEVEQIRFWVRTCLDAFKYDPHAFPEHFRMQQREWLKERGQGDAD